MDWTWIGLVISICVGRSIGRHEALQLGLDWNGLDIGHIEYLSYVFLNLLFYVGIYCLDIFSNNHLILFPIFVLPL